MEVSLPKFATSGCYRKRTRPPLKLDEKANLTGKIVFREFLLSLHKTTLTQKSVRCRNWGLSASDRNFGDL